MEIILARHAGFCEGVEHAYRIALDSIKRNKPIYIFGDLVHNKNVVSEFKKLGIKRVEKLINLSPGSTLIITAHGTTPRIINQAEKLRLNIVDTTCPWVKKAQRLASELTKSGRNVIIIGDRGHPEVVGLKAWAGRNARVVEKKKDLKGLRLGKKIGVVAQTTQSVENFRDIIGELRHRIKDLAVHNTICGATSRRQVSAKDLAKKVDMMLVIGDFRSANTKRLAKLCKGVGVITHHIQNERELKLKWLKGIKKLGITAGASTPARVIDGVLDKVNRYASKT